MNNFLKRLVLYLRASKRSARAVGVVSPDFHVDYSTSINYASAGSSAETSYEAESFEGFNGADFGGAGTADSWSDSSSADSGNCGGDGGTD